MGNDKSKQRDEFELLETGSDGYERLVDLIDGAEESLRMFFYTFADDTCGKSVVERLVAARERGVTVHLMVDDFGSLETPGNFFQPVIDAGGKVDDFQPHLVRSYLLRNHQKMAIADGGRAIVGSFNIADSHLDSTDEDAWRDIGVHVAGPAAERLTIYYDALFDWMQSERPHIRDLRDILKDANEDEGETRWIIGGPSAGDSFYARAVQHEFMTATRMDMIMAYFSPSRRILAAVRRLARDGKLRLIAAAKTDVHLSRMAGHHTYKKLLRAGAEIFEYQPRMLHTKLMVTDDAVYIGSGNFDVRSLYINMEIMLRVERPEFRKQVAALFEDELEDCKPITMDELKARGRWHNRFLWGAAYWVMVTVDASLSRFFAR
ncbi:MAG: phosphatidylserine/phosphatidylglycerophosphate/cardiolipin synthase family protein [Pacificimonas sp.]